MQVSFVWTLTRCGSRRRDWTTKAQCTGFPKLLSNNGDNYRNYAFKGTKYRLIVTTGTSIFCFDPRDWSVCSGTWPVVGRGFVNWNTYW